MTELWRTCSRDERYEVSNLGRVRRGERVLRGTQGGRYARINFTTDSRAYVHVLVLEGFVGPRPHPKAVARHLDDDPRNNVATNLTWGTQSDNGHDAVSNGRNSQALKTHCPQGHPYDAANTYVFVHANGRVNRQCRTCQRKAKAAYKARRRAARRSS